MTIALDISLVLFLGILCYQDFRYRRVALWALLGLGILAAVKRLVLVPGSLFLKESLLNSCFVLVQLALLAFYYLIRRKRLKDLWENGLGLGDILFFLILCLAFPTNQFVFCFLAGLVFSLIAYVLYLSVYRNANKEAPLAGLLALFWILKLVSDPFIHYQLPSLIHE